MHPYLMGDFPVERAPLNDAHQSPRKPYLVQVNPWPTFDYFVVFAEMRTGSNFLEANLNAFAGLTCHGEAFNPHFIGYPNSGGDCWVLTQAERDAIQRA